VLLQAEVPGLQHSGHLDEAGIIHQNGAQHKPLRVQIGGESLLESYVGYTHERFTNVATRAALVKTRARKLVDIGL